MCIYTFIATNSEVEMKLPFSKELERFEVKGRIIVVAFAILFGALIYYFDGVWSFICKLFSFRMILSFCHERCKKR